MASSLLKGFVSGVRSAFGRGDASSTTPLMLGPQLAEALQESLRRASELAHKVGTSQLRRVPGEGVITNDAAGLTAIWAPFYVFDNHST